MKKKFILGKTKIQYAGPLYDDKEINAMIKSIKKGWFGVGKKAREFEEKFSRYMGIKETVVINSGSSANLLALVALDLPAGSEVITSACVFPTTFNPIIQNNLIPVVIDVEPGTYNINPNLIESAITKRTKALMILHNLGNPCDMTAIMEIANKYRLIVIEDNCDALGSRFSGRLTGTFGDVATSSFYVAHHITMGEGGALSTNDIALAEKVRSLRDWGRACTCKTCVVIKDRNAKCIKRYQTRSYNLAEGYDARYLYTNIGYNLKPLEFQCAMGVEQLKKLPDFIRKRKRNFKLLYNLFKNYEDYFILPRWLAPSEPSWFAFPLTIKNRAPFRRKQLIHYFEDCNIETRLIFAGNIIRHPAYKKAKYKVVGQLDNADKIMRDSFFLGVWPGITDEEMDFVKNSINNFMNSVASPSTGKERRP